MSGQVKRFLVRFCGRVQGVGFRATTVDRARGLELHGYVRNEPDGSVLVDVDCAPPVVKKLIAEMKVAMSGNIESVDVQELESGGRQNGFGVRW